MTTNDHFLKRNTKTIFIGLLLSAAFILVIFQLHFFLLLFAGIFLGVILNKAASWVTGKISMRYGLALVLVLLVSIGLIVGLFMLIGPSVVTQVKEMIDTLPSSIDELKTSVTKTSWGQQVFDKIPENPSDLLKNKGQVFSRVSGFFSTGLSALTDFVIILVTGIFIASDPTVYKKGFLSLFTVFFRPRLSEVLDKIQSTLSLWLLAKLISMLIVGISTAIGLQLLGIPLPYALAFIAALFSFIPNIGPYLALAPAVLIGFMQGADKALYVAILYFSIQIVESYLVTPMIEKKMVSLPPALTLIWMVLMGVVAGILGLVLATPLLAALIVLVGELYVKDHLEKRNKIIEAENTPPHTGG